MDGSHIEVGRHLPLRCHLINLGGCIITYGRDFGCRLFSEPIPAVEDDDLYLRSPNGAGGGTLIARPLLGALPTVREVERLADAVESLHDDRPVLALLHGTLAFGTCSAATTPVTSPILSSESTCNPPWLVCGQRPPTCVPWRWRPALPDPEPRRRPVPSAPCSATRQTPTVTGSAPPSAPT